MPLRTPCAWVAAVGVLLGSGSARAETLLSPSELQADFAAMYEGLTSGAYDLFAFTPRAALDAAYRRELARLDQPMTKTGAELRFQRFAALAHQGHARVDFPYGAWSARMKGGARAFPIGIRIVDRRVYVRRDQSGLEAVEPGDEIVTLAGEPARAWLDRTARNVSAETPYMAHSLLEYDFPLYLWAELGDVQAYDVVLRKRDGRTVAVRLPARTQEEMRAAEAREAPALDLDSPRRRYAILQPGLGYLRPGPFYNAEAKTGSEAWDVSGFQAFLDTAFAAFLSAKVESLIIDLRGNPGGDNLFSDPMVAWFANRPFRFFSTFKVKVSPQARRANARRLAEDVEAAGPVSRQYAEMYVRAHDGDRVDFTLPLAQPRAGPRYQGRVFVLVDRQTYSNAVSVAALVQDYGFGVVLGEETSDVAAAFGAMEQFTLPASGIVVRFPKAYIVRPSGDPRVRGVRPDIPIQAPVVEGPDDPVLQAAVRIATRAPPVAGKAAAGSSRSPRPAPAVASRR
jgi:hypothetical protein